MAFLAPLATTSALSTAAAIAGAGSALLAGVSAYQQAKAAQAQAEARAEERRRAAEEMLRTTAAREEELRRRVRLLLAEQRTATAQAGLGGASVVDMLAFSREQAERDALELRRRGLGYAAGALADMQTFRGQARAAGMTGTLGLAQGLLGAGIRVAEWAARRPGWGETQKGS